LADEHAECSGVSPTLLAASDAPRLISSVNSFE
jgi:hypothetical protein